AADREADAADLAARLGSVGVVAHLGREVERHGQTGLALLEEVAEPTVRLLGRREPRVLAHGPEAAPVHRRLDATGERRLPGEAEVALRVESQRVEVGVRVEVGDLDVGARREAFAPLGGSPQGPRPGRDPPALDGLGRARPRFLLAGHRRTTSTSPFSIVWPSPTATRSTVPARGARSSFCIFIASTIRRVRPASTASPATTRTAATLPGMIARISAGPSAAAASSSRVARRRSSARAASSTTSSNRQPSTTTSPRPRPSPPPVHLPT